LHIPIICNTYGASDLPMGWKDNERKFKGYQSSWLYLLIADKPESRHEDRYFRVIAREDGVVPLRFAPYRCRPEVARKLKQLIDDMLTSGKIERAKSAWAFPVAKNR